MKKTILTFVIVLITINSFSQKRATVSNDTLYYGEQKVFVGDTLQIGYGSGSNKVFEFIEVGVGLGSTVKAPSSYSKFSVRVVKIYKQFGKYYFKTKDYRGNNLIIDVEGAIDNRELIVE